MDTSLTAVTRVLQWLFAALFGLVLFVNIFVERHPPSNEGAAVMLAVVMFLLLLLTLESGFSKIVGVIQQTQAPADKL